MGLLSCSCIVTTIVVLWLGSAALQIYHMFDPLFMFDPNEIDATTILYGPHVSNLTIHMFLLMFWKINA